MPLTAKDRITLLRVKIERAKQHACDLEKELLPWRDKYHDAYLYDEDLKTGERYNHWVRIPQYPFSMLSIAGDIIHNLRSSLDHLAYQLCIAGSNGTPSRRVEFPISKDRDTYESEKARKVAGMRPDAIKHIDTFKPYKGGNEVLWRIHELDIIDKHRFVFTVGDDALFTSEWHPENDQMVGFLLRPRGLKADAPLFSGAFSGEMDKDVKFAIKEAVATTGNGQRDALFPALNEWISYIELLVFSFEPHLSS